MNLSASPLTMLGVLAISLAPLEAAYIQNISFGYDVSPGFTFESGSFAIQYRPGYHSINGHNGSIDWMTMTVGSITRDLVRDHVVVADHFGFSFIPTTGQVQIGTMSDTFVGFAPGYFMYSISPRDWEIRHATSPNVGPSSAYAPINYMRVGAVQNVPENGGTGALMLGGLVCLGMAARNWRRKAGES